MVWNFTPYSLDKRLGVAYNNYMRLIPDGDAACLMDYDCMFLTPDAIFHVNEYHRRYPDAVLTCLTNRISHRSVPQLLTGKIDENADMRYHIGLAEKQKQHLYKVTEISRDFSGMCLIIPRKVWERHPFDENLLCLGNDTHWGRTIRKAGVKIYVMTGIYAWHSYRLLQGVKDKSHLLPKVIPVGTKFYDGVNIIEKRPHGWVDGGQNEVLVNESIIENYLTL